MRAFPVQLRSFQSNKNVRNIINSYNIKNMHRQRTRNGNIHNNPYDVGKFVQNNTSHVPNGMTSNNVQCRQITTNPSNLHKLRIPQDPDLMRPSLVNQEKQFVLDSRPFKDLVQDITVEQMLRAKSLRGVFTIDSEASCFEAARVMALNNIGSVLVCERGAECKQPVGIFTESDFLAKFVLTGRDPAKIKVKEVMSDRVISVNPQFTLENCAAIMATKNIRHLPVTTASELDTMDGDFRLEGILSAREVLANMYYAAEASTDINLHDNTVADVFEKMGRKSSDFCCVDEDDTVQTCIATIVNKDIDGVFVLDEDRLVGVFTERDFLRRVFLEGKSLQHTKVSEVMTKNVKSIDPEASLHECLSMMAQNAIETLPLIPLVGSEINSSDKSEFIGLVTAMDVINFLEIAENTGLEDSSKISDDND